MIITNAYFIVPISINYEKLMDGNFIREQMGQNKVRKVLDIFI